MKKILFIFLLAVIAVLGYYFYQRRAFTKQKVIQEIKTNILKRESSEETKEKESGAVTASFFLEIDNPKNKVVVDQPTIVVSGKTVPEAEVFINDKETRADNQGDFSLSINLEEGENTLVIVASDKEGNYQEKELTVFLESLE